MLASGGSDTLVRLWDVDTERLLSILRGHTDSVDTVAFSGDGELLASGGRDRHIQLWDIGTDDLISTFQVKEGAIRELAFSTDDVKLKCVTQEGALFIRE